METTFRFTRKSSNPTQWVTEYQHKEEGLDIALSVSIGVQNSAPDARQLEMAALDHVIHVLQGRAAVLRQEEARKP